MKDARVKAERANASGTASASGTARAVAEETVHACESNRRTAKVKAAKVKAAKVKAGEVRAASSSEL